MELKLVDRKLLSYLYHSFREPASRIAKAMKLSRIQVEYNMKKYEHEGLIKKYPCYFDYSKFGYNYFVSILVKLENFDLIDKFVERSIKSKNLICIGKMIGKYDLYMDLIFKNEKEFNLYLDKLNLENDIDDLFIMKYNFTELYPLKFLDAGNYNEKNYFIVGEAKERKFDRTEIEILRLLKDNSRIRLIDIANKLNISSELALYKLKKLENEKIILGSRVLFDMKKLGYFYSGVLMNIKNLSENEKEKIKRFARSHAYTNSLGFFNSKPNCFMQFFHKTHEELRKSLGELKSLLKDKIDEWDVLFIEEDEYFNTLPFL